MDSGNTDELMKKISILLDAQLASVSRIIVLEQAFMLLVGSLASNEDNPVQTLESLIAKLERNLKALQGSEGVGGSSPRRGSFRHPRCRLAEERSWSDRNGISIGC